MRPTSSSWPGKRSAEGSDVLISAPTGSGKTLAAFLSCLDGLVRAAMDGSLQDETSVVYVSPLKALSNDIQKNLDRRLQEISKLAAEKGLLMPPIRVAVRTGDTPMAERQQMVKRPPHILVTTPESLFILLTAERSREMLKTARTMIIDEIHAMVDDKRGSHLALSLARLTIWSRKPEDARFSASACRRRASHRRSRASLFAPTSSTSRSSTAATAASWTSPLKFRRMNSAPVASNEMWAEIYDRLTELILAHRTTLVFVNTRRLAERVAHHLAERLGETAVLAHHGSLSRRSAAGCGAETQERRIASRRRYRFAGTGHRYRLRRTRLSDRLAASDRRRAAAHRPLRPSRRSEQRSERDGCSRPRATNWSNAPRWFTRFTRLARRLGDSAVAA